MRCQTVRWYLARFVRMSWRAELSDSQYDSEFQTEGALTLKAFADNATTMLGTKVTFYWTISAQVE